MGSDPEGTRSPGFGDSSEIVFIFYKFIILLKLFPACALNLNRIAGTNKRITHENMTFFFSFVFSSFRAFVIKKFLH